MKNCRTCRTQILTTLIVILILSCLLACKPKQVLAPADITVAPTSSTAQRHKTYPHCEEYKKIHNEYVLFLKDKRNPEFHKDCKENWCWIKCSGCTDSISWDDENEYFINFLQELKEECEEEKFSDD